MGSTTPTTTTSTTSSTSMSHISSTSLQAVGTPWSLFQLMSWRRGGYHWDLAADPDLAKCPNYFGVKPEFAHLIDEAVVRHRAEFGDKKKAQLNAAITAILTEHNQNALLLDWSTICGTDKWLFVNPTYYNLGEWTEKLLEQHKKGCKIEALIPASIGSGWYTEFIEEQPGVSVWVLDGRLKFPGYSNSAGGYHMVVSYDGTSGWGGKPFENPRIWKWKEGARVVGINPNQIEPPDLPGSIVF